MERVPDKEVMEWADSRAGRWYRGLLEERMEQVRVDLVHARGIGENEVAWRQGFHEGLAYALNVIAERKRAEAIRERVVEGRKEGMVNYPWRMRNE